VHRDHRAGRIRKEVRRQVGDESECIGKAAREERYDGGGIGEPRSGTGLSIVRALVRDELRGTLELRSEKGTRAEVTFPVS